MATFTSARAAGNFPTPGPGHASQPVMLNGFYNITANPADGDIYQMFRIPKNVLIHGGWFTGTDMDTGTEALDLDVGWAANGTAAAATYIGPDGTSWTDSGYTADPDGFVNSGVLTGDAIATDLVAAGVFWRPIILGKPLYFADDTMCQVEANAAAATLAAGNMQVMLWGSWA